MLLAAERVGRRAHLSLRLLTLRLLRARDQVAAPPRLARLLGVVVRGGRLVARDLRARAAAASWPRSRSTSRCSASQRARAWASADCTPRVAPRCAAATSARHVSSATPAASCSVQARHIAQAWSSDRFRHPSTARWRWCHARARIRTTTS